MNDFDRLRGSDDEQDERQAPQDLALPRSRAPLIGLAVLLVVVAVGMWWWLPGSTPPATRTATAPATGSAESAPTTPGRLGVGEPDSGMPALGDLDAYVRPILAALSARPELAALLASDGLVRRFVVSVEAVARGASPARQVRAVAPRGAFQVKAAGEALTIDPSSYDRYDGLVRMVEDLDPAQLARIYGRLRPRLEEAHAELGVDGTFDQVMERAILHLLATPDLPPTARVQAGKGTNYVYSDAAVESLSAAQRQLLRLGPARAARVKQHLRTFADALGVPPERLPR